MRSHPAHARQARRRWKTTIARYRAVLANGAGLTADKAIRVYFNTYNTRNWTGGLHNMPSSFNALEAFFRYVPEESYFELLAEVDHVFSVEDFFDFVTSEDCPDDPYSEAMRLNESTIYQYSAYDDPHRLIMSTEDGSAFGLASFSMVRRADEVVVMVVAGELSDDDQEAELAKNLDADREYTQQREAMMPQDRGEKHSAVPLEGTDDLWRTTAVLRLNLATRTFDVRYLLRDMHISDVVISDDPIMYDDFCKMHGKEEGERQYKGICDDLDRRNTLFEIAKTGVLLPSYFRFKLTLVRGEKRETDIRKLVTASDTPGEMRTVIRTKVERKHTVRYRRVSAIRIEGSRASTPIGNSYTPPEFQVEVAGFWRRLSDPTAMGKDPSEKPVKGRTWVSGHVRWRDRPRRESKVVFIKSKISAARRIVEFEQAHGVSIRDLEDDQALPLSEHADEPTPGYIYVLTNAALGTDIFKVGMTTKEPEERAKQLSSSSGVPVPFLVADQWSVSDIRAAEKAAHSALRQYRINEAREFFQTKFMILRKTLENAIERYLENG